MDYREFDVAAKDRSDRLAQSLRAAGIRFEQCATTQAQGRPEYVINVHHEDLDRASEIYGDVMRRDNEAFVRTLHFVRHTFTGRDMLKALQPNEAGYYASCIHHGGQFDPTRWCLVRGGWDHEHCYVCWAKVLPGAEWWTTHPANFEDEIGLCLDCFSRLFE
jgi:hypothetical protein